MKDAYSFDASDEAGPGELPPHVRRLHAHLQALRAEAFPGRGGHRRDGRQVLPRVHGAGRDGRERGGLCARRHLCRECREGDQPRARSADAPSTATGPRRRSSPRRAWSPSSNSRPAPHGVEAHRRSRPWSIVADSKPVLVLLRGDDQLNEAKFTGALGTTVSSEPPRRRNVSLAAGRASGQPGRGGRVEAPRCTPTTSCRAGRGMVTGANEDGFHLRHVDVARDRRSTRWADLRTVRRRASCARPRRAAEDPARHRGRARVQAGHEVQRSLGASFLDADGQQKPCVMGCYGIGVTRTLQAVIEQSFDANGIIWPVSHRARSEVESWPSTPSMRRA
jgi:prolyl-tRNA synthetase